MNLKDLQKPFPESEIEWRIGQAGKKGNGQIWATCLAYVQARAIMNRLDDVCGPENWKATYRTVVGSQGIAAGVICELSIKCGDEWVTKEDGAEQTDIESFKGGISSALKRAAVAWGVGRYLYNLDRTYVNVVEQKTPGATWAKTKDGAEFYWEPPRLSKEFLPDGHIAAARPVITSNQPEQGDGIIGNTRPTPEPKKVAAPVGKTVVKVDKDRAKIQTEVMKKFREWSGVTGKQMSSLLRPYNATVVSDLNEAQVKGVLAQMDADIVQGRAS